MKNIYNTLQNECSRKHQLTHFDVSIQLVNILGVMLTEGYHYTFFHWGFQLFTSCTYLIYISFLFHVIISFPNIVLFFNIDISWLIHAII